MPFSVTKSKLFETPLCGTIFNTLPGVKANALAANRANAPTRVCFMRYSFTLNLFRPIDCW